MSSHSSTLLAAFEFLSLPMLGWLAAAALPWLIHRWNRRQHRTTSWAAVDLLLIAVGQRSRQVKLQQWLLIAVRTAILVLVALAAAEPMLQHWALGSSGIGRSHTIIILDQSYSMGLRTQETSRLERAKAQARQLVESRRSGDVFSVIGWAQASDNVLGRPTTDVSLVLSAISSLTQTEEIAELSVATRAAQVALERAKSKMPSLDRHEVIFFSDLARNTWLTRLEVQSQLEELSERARLTVVDVGEGHQENVAIVDLAVEPKILMSGREVSVVATLQCFGDSVWNDLDIELSIDGQTVGTKKMSLSAADISTVRFVHQFEDEGPHTVQVAVADEVDKLSIDNRRWLVVEVRPQLRVACIAGKPGAADDIARALAPNKLSDELAQTIFPEIFHLSQLGSLDLTEYDAVFLCSTADLNQHESDKLTRFVKAGGGLAVFLDGQTLTESFARLLPVVVHEVVPEGEFYFDALAYAHPITEPFRGNENAGLLKVAVMKYCRLEIKPEHPSVESVLAFDSGDPALVVEPLRLGRVAVLAIPSSLAVSPDEQNPWSSFAVSPSFLPVMRELLANLVRSSWLKDRNYQVGQSAAIAWDLSRRKTQVTVRRPDGTEQVLRTPAAEEQGKILISETPSSGIYQVDAAGELIARFAVNLDPLESDLSSINPQELPTFIAPGPKISSVADSIRTADFSFAPSLLASAAVLLLAELALACWLGRGWQ